MMKVWMLVLVLGISAIGFANGQDVPPCLAPLSPCIKFLNSTNPPQTCCNPIKEMNATHNSCFCQLALTPGALEALGTTIPQALQLIFLHQNFSIFLFSSASIVAAAFWLDVGLKFSKQKTCL